MAGHVRLLALAANFVIHGEGQVMNLALGRVPFASSETAEGDVSKVTDGDFESQWHSRGRDLLEPRPDWRLPEHYFVEEPPASVPEWRLPSFNMMQGDYPGVLLVDLGAPSRIDNMRLYMSTEPGGFRTLKVYRSLDGLTWLLTREEKSELYCSAGVTGLHPGWPQKTRYVLLEMQDRCSGLHHPGMFSVAEWQIWGSPWVQMIPFLQKSWPECPDLRPCFAYSELEATKRARLADDACDGFSFSSQRMMGGSGSGCLKTHCRGNEEVNGTEALELPNVPLGRGSFGYWAKRRWPPPFELQHYQAAFSVQYTGSVNSI